ncbi:hypothetical protein B4U80_13312, partial [Leptotrombidium deliense]
SPFGLSMALGMLLKAAKGKTYDDIYKMLNMGEKKNKDNIHNIFKLLPYKGEFSMFVMLPDEKYGLSKMIEEWPKNKLSDYIVKMNKSSELISVYLPKFEVDYSTKLLGILASLGADIRPALTPFSPGLVITDAFQTAVIKVYEAGTEAAAVTVFTGTRMALQPAPNPLLFKADHPFSYCIRDMRRGINVFCGTVLKFK